MTKTKRERELWRIGCDVLANRMDAIVHQLITVEPFSCYDLGSSVTQTYRMLPHRGPGFVAEFKASISSEHRREQTTFTLEVDVADAKDDKDRVRLQMTTADCPPWLIEIIPDADKAKLMKSKIRFRATARDPDDDVPF